MPYKIEKVDDGFKVCKTDNSKCFSSYPLTLENAQKQLYAIEINEHKNENLFTSQLKNIGLTPKKYLSLVKHVAKKRGYDPKLLSISNDSIHKLNYGGTLFGRVGYNDKIIYAWLEHNNKIPEGTMKKKYTNYRARAEKVMKETNNKYSPSSLSFNLIW